MLKFYSRLEDKALVLETWGASTKHPDAQFVYTHEERLQEMCFQAPWTKDYKFLLECASKMLWAQHARDIATLASRFYEQCYNDNEYLDMFNDWA